MLRRICLSICCSAPALPAMADCRLALALALDVSRSVDGADYVIQTEGLAAALEDAQVKAAILSPEGTVALAVYFWSGENHQDVIVPWVEINGEDTLAGVAAKVRRAVRSEDRLPTALGWALVFGHELMAEAPDCARRVLDVSGDGRNNVGISARTAFGRVDYGDIIVNALAIGEHEVGIVDYYRTEVIRGLGSFVEVARTQADFPAAIRRKLLRELTGPVMGRLLPETDGRG